MITRRKVVGVVPGTGFTSWRYWPAEKDYKEGLEGTPVVAFAIYSMSDDADHDSDECHECASDPSPETNTVPIILDGEYRLPYEFPMDDPNFIGILPSGQRMLIEYARDQYDSNKRICDSRNEGKLK